MSNPAGGVRGPAVPEQIGPYEILEALTALDGAERYLATTGSELVQISVMLPDPTKGPLATRELSRAIKQLTNVAGEHVVRTFRAERAASRPGHHVHDAGRDAPPADCVSTPNSGH